MAKTLAAAVLVLMLCAFGTAHAGIIGFDPGPGSFGTYYAGSSFDGWTVTSGSIDWIGNYWQAPVSGQGSVDLDGNSPGAISTSLTTAIGTTYAVTFSLSGNPDGAPTQKSVTAAAGGGGNTFTYTIGANTHGNMNYVVESFDFTANAVLTPLTFTSNDQNSPYGPVIGNVQVSAVPVPPSVLLLAPGLLGLVGLKKRFKA
jgi:choice-of-anchor C domain-containing protein